MSMFTIGSSPFSLMKSWSGFLTGKLGNCQKVLALIVERQNLWRLGYGKDTASHIPFHRGFKPHILKSLVVNSGFEDVGVDGMEFVNSARRTNIPFYYNLLQEENFCVTAHKL